MTKATRRWGYVLIGGMLANLAWELAVPAYPVVVVAKLLAVLLVVWAFATAVRVGGGIDG